MNRKKRILLKLTGEIFTTANKQFSRKTIDAVAAQLMQLNDCLFGIVIGGGNFFRGNQQGKHLGATQATGHQVGMLATMMNGLLLKDLFQQKGLSCTLLSAIHCPQIAESISERAIEQAFKNNDIVIFTGGTGNPFFSTDTTAIIRGLQMNADEIWKGTKVDGIYTQDPKKYSAAQLIPCITHQEVIAQQLNVMDTTAFTLAQQHQQPIRIFNIFSEQALIQTAQNSAFGSLIKP